MNEAMTTPMSDERLAKFREAGADWELVKEIDRLRAENAAMRNGTLAGKIWEHLYSTGNIPDDLTKLLDNK